MKLASLPQCPPPQKKTLTANILYLLNPYKILAVWALSCFCLCSHSCQAMLIAPAGGQGRTVSCICMHHCDWMRSLYCEWAVWVACNPVPTDLLGAPGLGEDAFNVSLPELIFVGQWGQVYKDLAHDYVWVWERKSELNQGFCFVYETERGIHQWD